MLRVIPKHKGTDHMQADLKSRIAKLRKEGGKKAGKGGFSYIVPREGAGQVALAGPRREYRAPSPESRLP